MRESDGKFLYIHIYRVSRFCVETHQNIELVISPVLQSKYVAIRLGVVQPRDILDDEKFLGTSTPSIFPVCRRHRFEGPV